jgi:hypothetical protein
MLYFWAVAEDFAMQESTTTTSAHKDSDENEGLPVPPMAEVFILRLGPFKELVN